jgi:hypothetical protein
MGRHTTVIQEYEVVISDANHSSHHRIKHYNVRDHHKAIAKAQSAGYRVIQVHKAETDKILPAVKNLRLLEPIGTKDTAIALENIAFRRARRIEDKNKYDKDVD